jgi:hypothetical protein
MQPPHQPAGTDICIDLNHHASGALFDALF